jgi:hypothetical protein
MSGRRTGAHFAWPCSIPSRARIFPREFSVASCDGSLQKERERSAARRMSSSGALIGHLPAFVKRTGRLTALRFGVFNPWGPACLWPGGVRRFRGGTRKAQGTSPGRHSAPGGRPKDSRDHDCEIAGAGADPHSHPVSPAGRPSSEWGYVRHTHATRQCPEKKFSINLIQLNH